MGSKMHELGRLRGDAVGGGGNDGGSATAPDGPLPRRRIWAGQAYCDSKLAQVRHNLAQARGSHSCRGLLARSGMTSRLHIAETFKPVGLPSRRFTARKMQRGIPPANSVFRSTFLSMRSFAALLMIMTYLPLHP